MFRKSLALSIMGLLMGNHSIPVMARDVGPKVDHSELVKGGRGKGQSRATKPKASGAAAMKRTAKKRANIRAKASKR
jgi:hypothetical protein